MPKLGAGLTSPALLELSHYASLGFFNLDSAISTHYWIRSSLDSQPHKTPSGGFSLLIYNCFAMPALRFTTFSLLESTVHSFLPPWFAFAHWRTPLYLLTIAEFLYNPIAAQCPRSLCISQAAGHYDRNPRCLALILPVAVRLPCRSDSYSSSRGCCHYQRICTCRIGYLPGGCNWASLVVVSNLKAAVDYITYVTGVLGTRLGASNDQ